MGLYWLSTAGLDCSSRCPFGFWGSDCRLQCQCHNKGSCDTVDGSCQCLEGWRKPNCAERKYNKIHY